MKDRVNNKTAGSHFEKEFASILSKSGFWVHLFQDNKNGQPCDVIAARNGRTYLFDCKDCQGEAFPLRRMEENQYNAMHLFELTGNSRGKFVIRFREGQMYLVDYWQLGMLRDKGIKQINPADCRLYGEDFWQWLHIRNQTDGWSDKDAGHNWK